jgi:argininosuccinate lyase
MAKKEKSWQHRLSGDIDQLSVDFVESLSYDTRLYKYDIAGSVAHAHMLRDCKLITKNEFTQIRDALYEISEKIDEGKFKFDKLQEDIHMAIEAALIKKIGDTGKKLHTGRSRNDQVATDMRLWMRDEIELNLSRITALQKAFVKLAAANSTKIMPAYTHLQRAQPVVIGSYLLSFVEQLARDYSRFSDCRSRLNISPLGSGAVAGSTLPLDRESTAKQLGFADISYNSIDAVSDRDFCAEFIFACSMTMTHLSRLAEDWIIYCSSEFSFISIDDKYCTSSSMMPQKRNPDNLELIRGKTASVLGSLVAMLSMLKALPTSYNRDIQEDKIHIFNAADTLAASLEMAAAIVSNTTFNADQIEKDMHKGFLDATSLAEYLVKKGVPFRQAHGIVGSLVAKCEKDGHKLADLDLATLTSVCPEIQHDVYDNLGPQNVVEKYQTTGSASVTELNAQVKYWKEKLKAQ